MSPRPASHWSPGPVAAAVVGVTVLAVTWTRLYEGVGAGHIVALCAIAALPAAAAMAPRARSPIAAAAAAVAMFLILALALRASLRDLLTLDGQAWARAREILPDGLAQAAHTSLPVAASDAPDLVALLDVALAALAGVAVWQIVVRRRPVAGLVAVGVGLAYCWTVRPPDSPALAGVLALAGFVAVLALARWKGSLDARGTGRLGGTVALGGVALLVAVGLGSGPSQPGDGWWSWRDWDFGARSTAGPGAALDLAQSYGKLDWPSKPRVALTVTSDTARPLRAVSLEDFDGVAFTLADSQPSGATKVRDGTIVPDGRDSTPGEDVVQKVTLRSTTSKVIIASGRPQMVTGPFSGTADRVGDAIRVADALRPGQSYTVETRIPQATPAELTAAPPYDPGTVPSGTTRLRPTFWADPVEHAAVGRWRGSSRGGLARRLCAGARAGAAGGRWRGDALCGGQPHRGLPAQQLHL